MRQLESARARSGAREGNSGKSGRQAADQPAGCPRLERRGSDIDDVGAWSVPWRRLGPMDIAFEIGVGTCRLGERDAELLLILGRAARQFPRGDGRLALAV